MKGLGYLISTISVLLLGAVAWPKPDEPRWKMAALIAGMAASIIGMFCRYLAHRQKERELALIETHAGLPLKSARDQRTARGPEPAGTARAISSVD